MIRTLSNKPKNFLPYFFATTRSRGGHYHRYPTVNSVLFTLDGNWLNQRYTVKPIDYYDSSWVKYGNPRETWRESEDRVYSKSSSIPVLPMVKHIDVYLGWDGEQRDENYLRNRSDELRRIMTAAYNLGIPITYYRTARGWMSRAPGDRVDQQTVIDRLSPPPEGERYVSKGDYAKHMKAWIELIEKSSTAELSKEAQDVRYNYLLYSWDRGDDMLRNDLHNARPGTNEYPYAVKIVNAMVKNRIKSTKDLHSILKAKWEKIINRERELEKQNEVK
jgi:hypothetical protein